MLRLLLAALAVLVLACAFLSFSSDVAFGAVAHPYLFLAIIALAIAVLFLVGLPPHQRRRVLRYFVPAVALTFLAACTSGCANLKSADIPATIQALAAAGCKGNVSVSVGAATATGVSAGSAHVENSFTGDCDPSRVQKTAPAPSPTAAPAP